ncbi:glycoside hydrolase [Novosphingobium sp. ZN18A2]|uniref:glycoside hydrolase n=1 Tax=Novosphingobium sp. ZN18A2 TaxID=3079861 RepID=UPI0030D40C2E
MELTFVGLFQIVVGGLIVLAGRPGSALAFLIASSLFDGSAAIVLPALGGSSIPPVQFALLFVYLRILVPRGGLYGHFPAALRANAWLVLFCLYGLAMAFIGPRLFAGSIDVFPMRPNPNGGLFDVVPLHPTSQNLTGGTYMVGAMLLAVGAYVLARSEKATDALVSASVWSGWFLIVTGLLDVVSRGTPLEGVLNMFRNGDYAQFSVDVQGFVRIRGLMPEASTYASCCFAFFVVNSELWYRAIRPRATGWLAIALSLVLLLSTSSTAYVALGAYFAFLVVRALALPRLVPDGRIRRIMGFAFILLFLAAVMLAVVPSLPDAVFSMIVSMTVDKSSSLSGQQRLFWALQGIDALVKSHGLGIGPGSFRSSSIFFAILGSMGVIGIVSFTLYLLAVFQPMRRSSWGQASWEKGTDIAQTAGGAFASAAILGLIPAAVGSPVASPAATFTIFAGAALALRPALSRSRRALDEAGRQAPASNPAAT